MSMNSKMLTHNTCPICTIQEGIQPRWKRGVQKAIQHEEGNNITHGSIIRERSTRKDILDSWRVLQGV